MSKTIKIRMLTGVTASEYTYQAGEIVDAPEDRARDLLRANYATLVSTTADIETAADVIPREMRKKSKK